jgi:hypothetical protein
VPPELVMSLPNGADRPPLQVCVVRESGGWTPGAHVVVESGNHLELNERELEWLIGEAGPRALAALRGFRTGFQDGQRPGVPSAPAPRPGGGPRGDVASPSDEPPDLTGRAGSSVAGQGAPDRPEPAQPSTAEEQ